MGTDRKWTLPNGKSLSINPQAAVHWSLVPEIWIKKNAKAMANKQITPERDPLPEEFNSLAEAGEFWDTHSTADYEELMEDVSVEINLTGKPSRYYAVAQDIATQLQSVAEQQGVSTQTLINLWLQEKTHPSNRISPQKQSIPSYLTTMQ